MQRNIIICLMAIGLLAMLPGLTLAAGGSSSGGGMSTSGGLQPKARLTPEELAERSYARAVKHRVKAAVYEEKAIRATSDKGRKKQIAKANKEYKRCGADLDKALEYNPRLVPALSDLGFVLRKQGDYDGSLVTYDKALRLNPSYTPAIEYRGEAYLALGRLDDAKQAYMVLFRQDRALADQLLQAMQLWVERERGNTQSETAGREEFEQWLIERSNLAARTAALASPEKQRW